MLKDIIVSVSFASIGLVLYLATSNVVSAVKGNGWDRRVNAAYALARVGFAGMVGLITEAVWGLDEVPASWRSVLYAVAGVAVFFGYLGVVMEQRESRRPLTGRGGRDVRGADDPRDTRDKRLKGEPRDARDPRLEGDPRDPRDPPLAGDK